MNESDEKYPSNEIEESIEDDAKKDEEITPTTAAPDRQIQTLLRNILRWTLTLLIVFGLGFITSYILLFRPTQNDLEQTSAELSQLNQEISSLENQISELSQTNQDLERQVESAELRLMLLSAISDVRAANLAVADDNYAGALLSIRDASQTLREINDILSEDQSEIIATMQDNLTDIENILRSEPDTALNDLERLTTNLLRLESTLLK